MITQRQDVEIAIRQAKLIECAEAEYPEVRVWLQEYAARMVDQEQDIYALIALQEVRRLDQKFGYELGGTP